VETAEVYRSVGEDSIDFSVVLVDYKDGTLDRRKPFPSTVQKHGYVGHIFPGNQRMGNGLSVTLTVDNRQGIRGMQNLLIR